MKFKTITIHTKLIIIQAISLLLILLLLTIFNINIVQEEFFNSEVKKAKIIVETVSILIPNSIELEMFDTLVEDVIKYTHENNPNIIKTEIIVLNSKKRIKVENEKANKTKKEILVTEKIYSDLNKKQIAIMNIHYSYHGYEEIVGKYNEMFLLLLLVIGSSIVLSIYIGNKFLSPFYKLANKLMSFDPEKNSKIIISTNSNDEIGIIQNAINEAIKRMKKQQNIIIQQNKLASMGEMIGNIAHQWRQPLSELSVILMEIEAENDEKFNDEYLCKQIEDADKIIEYMSKTIDDFRDFFKSDREKEIFKISKACESAISIVKSSLKFNNITFEFKVVDDISLNGYPNAYSQVILNIISNAKDILIDRKIKNPKIAIKLSKKGDKSIVSILDNGGGIKQDILEKIFEPYFTTKFKSQGVGIGLYMSKMIIEQNMYGKLIVKNKNNGAEFQIII